MDEFENYMVAHWPRLVRVLVLLGCEPHEAEDVVQIALISCCRSWLRIRRAGDPDAYVYRAVLHAWAKSRRRRWWGEVPTEHLPDDSSTAWQDDQTLLLVMRSPDSVARRLVTCAAATGACRTDERVDGPVVIAGEGVYEVVVR
jgi:DNA-directed RNA polymerase specialized sigma24 family protein